MKMFGFIARGRCRRGLSLVEILFATAIAAVIAALSAGALTQSVASARQAREVSAGRSLIAAYLASASENDGRLMVAHYEGRSSEIDAAAMTLPDGTQLSDGALHRYPYRLAPYFDYRIDGVVLVNENRKQVAKAFPGSLSAYGTSLCPAFGINYYFVGGYVVDDVLAGEAECATRMVQVERPSSLLVFATAFQNVEGERIGGRFGVEPPRYRTALWDENLHVDARHDGRVLCAFLDGGVRLQTVAELRDMRLWSWKAAVQNNPNYVVDAGGNGGIGGPGGGRR